MLLKIDKNLIKNKFIASIETYNEHAIVQKKMAWELINLVIDFFGNKFKHILEIGSGTGLLTQELVDNLEFNKIITNDLSDDYKGIIRGILSDKNIDYKFIEGDAEFMIDMPENNDLVISNATFQWFEDLNKFVISARSLLNPEGVLAFTSFGPDNFKEIRSIYQKGLNYPTMQEILKDADRYYKIVYTNSYTEKLFFDHPFEVLKHMKNTGVTGLEKNNKIKPKEFSKAYSDNFSIENKGVFLTYNPYFIILKKK